MTLGAEAEAERRPVIIATIMREHGETGVQTHFREVRALLQGRGIDVQLITPFQSWLALAIPIFAVRRVLMMFSGTLSVWWYRYWHERFLRASLTRACRQLPEAVIYAQCPVSASAALRARRSQQTRVILAVHFNRSQADEWAERGDLARGGRLYASIKRFEAATIPRVDRLIFVSEFMRQALEESIPAVRELDGRVLTNFVEAPETAPEGRDAPRADCVAVGTLEPRKNQRFLLEVLAAAERRGHRVTLDIIGDGPDRASLEARARELNVASDVTFRGYLRNAASELSRYRVLAHGATIESQGIVLIEAMSRGLPVLAAPVGGIPEVFTDGREGRYWDLDDPESAAATLIDVLSDGARYEAMSAAARRRYEERFSPEAVGEELIDALAT